MEFIRGTTLVHLKIRCWSGQKKADRSKDVQVGADGKLPPKKLLDLGRKTIYPTSALDPMLNKRRAAERACLSVGTRFMGGYAVPDESVQTLIARLNAINVEFDEELNTFLSQYDSTRDAWLAEEENREFAHIFEDQIPDSEEVAQSYGFDFKLYKINPLEGFEPDEGEIANQVLHEVGLACREMTNRLLKRSRAISGKSLREQLDPFITKLDTMSFGNSRILAVLREFQHLQELIPLERIDKDHPKFGPTVTFLSMCDDASKLDRIYRGEFSVMDLISKSQPEPQSLDLAPAASSKPSGSTPPSIASAPVRMGGYF